MRSEAMQKTHLWGGLALAGLAAYLTLPRLWPKARLTVRMAVTTPFVSGVPGTSRATADPARGMPA
jgi:hypothetical protein